MFCEEEELSLVFNSHKRIPELYKSVELLYSDNSKQICWIPSYLAIENKVIYFENNNLTATIKKVYKEELSFERYHYWNGSTVQ